MALELSIHPLANRDFTVGLAWYRARSVRAAKRFQEQTETTFRVICENPAGHPFIWGEYRFAVVKRYPYRVIYRFNEVSVEVVAIAHGRRRPLYWRRRIGDR